MRKLSLVLMALVAMLLAGCDTIVNSMSGLQTSIPRTPTRVAVRATPTRPVIGTPTPRTTPRATPQTGTSVASAADAYVPPDVLLRYKALARKGYLDNRLDNGLFYLGAEDAPVTMEQFSSYSCAPCKNFNDTYFYNLFDLILAGELRYVFVPVTTTGEFTPTEMSRATYCAGEQGQYWLMHDVMFDWQTRYGVGGNDAGRLSAAAGQLGMDRVAFNSCMSSDRAENWMKMASDLVQQREIYSTPTVFFNGSLLDMTTSLADLRAQIDAKAKNR